MNMKNIKKFEKVVTGLVEKLGPSDIEYLKTHHELPAIKLTKDEAELLKGGRLSTTLVRFLCDAAVNGVGSALTTLVRTSTGFQF